ncbi:hypothetical protein ACFVFJ_44505 [Streptomyces sp. NPDC057717]|uniref:hypothetical protein n=1 Tax=Streptomyces sp. NPDC057717 TaxID=3346224 RepID=UPI0036ADD78A
MNLAASTGAAAIGSIGAGGAALILATWFWFGTRKKAKNGLGATPALSLGLIAGTVWMGAGQIWGVPDDLISRVLSSTQKTEALGTVGYGAISIVLVIVAYCLSFRPRAMGYLGIIMATTFSLTGGIWATVTATIADVATSLAS